jgi:hypothetical protein
MSEHEVKAEIGTIGADRKVEWKIPIASVFGFFFIAPSKINLDLLRDLIGRLDEEFFTVCGAASLVGVPGEAVEVCKEIQTPFSVRSDFQSGIDSDFVLRLVWTF